MKSSRLKAIVDSDDPILRRAREQCIVLLAGFVLLETAAALVMFLDGHHAGLILISVSSLWGLSSACWVLMWTRDVMRIGREHLDEVMRMKAELDYYRRTLTPFREDDPNGLD